MTGETQQGSPEAGQAAARVLVAGGGIGGLTAALALQRAGFTVCVLERARELGEVGAGIQISPNAWRVLESLGVLPELEPAMVRPEAIRIHSRRAGGMIGRVPLGDTVLKRYGAPYCVVHRADLHGALVRTARKREGIEIQLGQTVSDATQDDDGITVEVQGDDSVSSYRGVALIGADGVWSTVRRRLLRLPSAAFSGRIAMRATMPIEAAPELANHTGLWMGEAAHLVHYPISAGKAINLVAVVENDWQEETWSAPVARAAVLSYFEGWPKAARKLLEAPDTWLKWALCGVAPGTIWAEGRIALLGDAAHAMLPFMAQGGAMAIEDAHVLARCLAEDADTPAALLTYERARKDRVERVVRTARDNAGTYHLKGLVALVRDAGIRYLSGPRLLSRYDWLYGWRPE